MLFMRIRWLALIAAVSLAACGGSDNASQDASNAAVAQSKNASVRLDEELPEDSTSINSANAVMLGTSAIEEGKATPATNGVVAVDVRPKAGSHAGGNIDLGLASATDLEKRIQNNKRSDLTMTPKAYQIGFSRPVTAASNAKSFQQLLAWSPVDNGVQRGALRITSGGAKGIRIGLRIHALPNDTVLRVYAESGSQALETTGEHINTAIQSNVKADGDSEAARTYWLPITMGEVAILEVDLPPGRDISSVSFALPSIMHAVESPMQANLDQLQAKTECPALNPDATCTLPPAANAVAAMGYMSGGIGYVCTGTLLANSGTTQRGYFLTANHCINSQTVASTLDTFWFWRSSSCNSGTLNPGWIGLYSGATYLWGSSIASPSMRNPTGTDSTLLRLLDTPPAGAMFAGWTAQNQSVQTATNYIGLHNPGGSLLRRSDGKLTNYGILLSDDSSDVRMNASYPLYQVQWSTGITEGGSSGSAMFQNGSTSNPMVIGQLFGGFSRCPVGGDGGLNGPDYYGRFDIAYENGLINWLNSEYRMVFRFYNDRIGSHFFTSSVSERDLVRTNYPIYSYERSAFMVKHQPAAQLKPIYRFWHQGNGSHFYTISESEKDYIIANFPIYLYEGPRLGYASPTKISGTVPLYRFYRSGNGTHFYTTSASEKTYIEQNYPDVYKYERIAFYVWAR